MSLPNSSVSSQVWQTTKEQTDDEAQAHTGHRSTAGRHLTVDPVRDQLLVSQSTGAAVLSGRDRVLVDVVSPGTFGNRPLHGHQYLAVDPYDGDIWYATTERMVALSYSER